MHPYMADLNNNNNCHITKKDKYKKQLNLVNGGKIVYYSPLNSVQVIFYDIHSNEIPDLWKLGFRRKAKSRYLRALICRNGSCNFTLNDKTKRLSQGDVMIDYSLHDKGDFNFIGDYFIGVEISLQATAIEESSSFRQLRKIIKAMCLPEQEIRNSNGYVFTYTSGTEKILDKYIEAGFNGMEDIINIAFALVIGHSLGNDLKGKTLFLSDKQMAIADDIYKCLTYDFSTKWTAQMFAEKYGVSDTTVKRNFKNAYGYGFKEYQVKVRMEYAAEILTTTNMRIVDVSSSVGFSDYSKFTKAFKKYFGLTPSDYRRSSRIHE